jgi:hypothetical protein
MVDEISPRIKEIEIGGRDYFIREIEGSGKTFYNLYNDEKSCVASMEVAYLETPQRDLIVDKTGAELAIYSDCVLNSIWSVPTGIKGQGTSLMKNLFSECINRDLKYIFLLSHQNYIEIPGKPLDPIGFYRKVADKCKNVVNMREFDMVFGIHLVFYELKFR